MKEGKIDQYFLVFREFFSLFWRDGKRGKGEGVNKFGTETYSQEIKWTEIYNDGKVLAIG